MKKLKKLPKEKFKQIVSNACQGTAFSNLILKKENHSKGKEIIYTELKLQSYLKSQLINVQEAKMLFKLRSRTMKWGESELKGRIGTPI